MAEATTAAASAELRNSFATTQWSSIARHIEPKEQAIKVREGECVCARVRARTRLCKRAHMLIGTFLYTVIIFICEIEFY